MRFESILPNQKSAYNSIVSHPLQAYEWGEFREKTGVKVIRKGVFDGEKLIDGFQLTIHPVPKTNFTIGYLPKGNRPSREVLAELQKIGKKENCIFIQLEPNIRENSKFEIRNSKFRLQPAAHPLFTKYTFVLDLTKSEEDLLKQMHAKTRYNIRVATRHGVTVQEEKTPEAFERYWHLTEETTKRQKFYAHTKNYHELQWEVLQQAKDREPKAKNALTSHLLTARYEGKILTTMLFFVFKDTLYYPYGASSNEARNTMHSVLTMWEGIRFGKKLGLKSFDMWGSLAENPDPKDPWYGFHRFKQGFGPELVEFVGSYDLVIHPLAYQGYKIADKLRWLYLRIKK